MKIITIIPARSGSKRIPRKNIIPFLGKPLVEHSIEHAQKSRLVNRVIISTDDEEIAGIAAKCGAEVIKRPQDISGDKSSSETALLHVVDHLEKTEGYSPDIVVFLQCTSPLRKNDDIDNAIKILINKKSDSLFSVYRFNKYIWRLKNGSIIPVNYDYQNRWREQDFPIQYQENGSIYVFKPWVLKELKNRLGGKIEIFEMDYINSFQIDSYEDLALCECILEKGLGNCKNV